MANNNRNAEVSVHLNGTEEAGKKIDEMVRKFEGLRKKIEETKLMRSIYADSDPAKYKALGDEIKQMEKLFKMLGKAIRDTQSGIYATERNLEQLGRLSEDSLKSEQRIFKRRVGRASPLNDEEKKRLQEDAEKLIKVTEELERRKNSVLGYTSMFQDIENAADKSLTAARQRLQELIGATKQNAEELKTYREQLAKIQEEEQRRVSSKAGAVMGNLGGSSVDEIRNAIKVTEQLRDAQKLGSQEWEIYNDEIQRAQKYLSDFNELGKRLAMADRMNDLGKASAASLAELRKYWQEQVDGAERGSAELAEYQKRLTKVIEEEQRRVSSKAGAVMGNLGGSSVDEIRNAIKVTEQLRDAQKLGSQEWVRYNDEIQHAQKYLSDFNELGKRLAMADRMNDLGKASAASLAELRKYWQEQVDGAERGSAELAEYQKRLTKVIEEEQRRVSSKATGVIGDVKGGTFEGTIGETKEAIKLLEEYKKSLKLTDTDGLKEVDEVIKDLNDRLKLSTEEVMSLQDALKQAADVGEGRFNGRTYEDLEKLKKTLEEYKKQLKITDTQGLKEINDALENISQRTQSASDGVENIGDVLDNIKSVPLEQLEKAAAALQRRLSMTARTTDEYVTASADLRRVNAEIDRVKNGWKEHNNQIVATMKRLTSYVLVYAGFNEVWGRTKQLFGENVELSDSLADIQKTTGLSAEAVGELSREIDSIDTRTAQKELHDLAYEAGKLGISAKEDVLGFVRAGNQLLVALGEDLGGAEAVRQLMKVNAILGETQKLGIEKSLLATGSAINEITQTSRASAGAITDIVTRIGAIGNAANLSMADLIALAGSADALGQQAEMSGTALNKFISSLTANTTEVAQAVGLSDDYLKDMINQGKTMEAIIAVLDKMNAMGGLDVLNPIIKDLGSDGERIKQVLVTLSGGIDELKAQVFTSSRAFAEATSVTNEYNIKNENAAAIIARMGNSIKENLVNSGLVAWMTDVLRWLDSLPRKWERAEGKIKVFAIALSSLTGFLIAVSGAIQKASFNFLLFCDSVKKGTIGVGSALRNLKRAFSSNLFGWLVLGITAVVDALIIFKNEVKEAMKYQSEFDLSTEKEVAELENLRYAIDRANKGTGEKAALIKQLNDKYGTYLGFMVTENNYAEKQEYIYKMINERLKENIALKMKDKMSANIVDKYADKLQDMNTKILGVLKKIGGIGETNLADASRLISEGIDKIIENRVQLSGFKFPEKEFKSFFDKYGEKINAYGARANKSELHQFIMDMVEIRRKMDEETRSTRMYLEDHERLARKEATQLMQEDLKKQTDSGILGSEDISKLKTYSQQATTFINRLREDIAMLGEQQERNGELSKEEAASLKEKKALLEQYVKSSQEADKRIQALGMRSVWGESMDLDKAGVDKLVATYKKLEGMMKSINEDKDYADTFASRGFKSAKEEYEALKKMEEDVKKVLADKWGRDEHGNWLDPKKGKGGGEKDAMKEQMEAALAALETYFVNRQTVIKEQAAKEEITAEEMNRQLEKNEFNHLDARVKLRKMFLGELGAMTEEEKKQYGLQEKDFEKLSKFLMDKGSAMRDGIRLGIAEDLLKMREDLLKHQEAIRKILLEDDYAGMVDQEFADAIDRLELLFGKGEDMAVKAGESRLLRMKELSKEAYLINEEELKSRMSAMEEFSGWERGKAEEDYAALLVMLRKYHDDYESAENREVERRRRIADKKWKKSGEKDAWDETDRNAERDVELMQGLQGLGLASDGMVEDAKLEMYRLRVEASKAYMEQLQKEMDLEVAKAYSDKMIAEDMYRISKESGVDDPELKQQAFEADMAYEEAKRQQALMTLEARKEVNEAMTELEAQETEVQKRKLNTLKGYTDAVVDFGEQMGEAAFGEVEDRKAAAKQLLQTTMKLTKDLIMQKVQKLIIGKMLDKQEIANEAATQGTITALHGSQAITDMTVTAAKTQGDIAAGTAAGSAKTIGELGWWGIPLIAVIGAALSALMGMAMGKLNKAKEEVASATGVSSNKGRVAAGMLTYAKGDYPVLGNDGKIYNASYEKELKTGVYGGGAHFGIFSEKKPEMIVDGDTTKKIMLDYPHIYESILTIARHGQLKSAALPTYASGSYPGNTSPSALPGMVVAQGEPVNAEMMAMLSGVASALNALTDRLNRPINATMDPYAANKQIQKADRFMRKNGLLG